MEVAKALRRFDDIGINISVNDEKIVVTSPIPLTDSQRSFLKAHKEVIVDTITSESVSGISMKEISQVAGEDWPDIKDDPEMIKILADSICIRHMRESGEIPPDYIHKAICDGCGPVWLFVTGHVQGCPWCFNRKNGLPIPTPATTHPK